jgi:hypothetical protein
MSGLEEEEQTLKDTIDTMSSTEVVGLQNVGGAREGLGKCVRKAPKPFRTD